MFKKLTLACFSVAVFSWPVLAQDKTFSLQTPDVLTDSGFIKHLLPRFSLKTGIRIKPITGAGDAAFGDKGVPVFTQGDTVWHFDANKGPITDVFEAWLLSDIGKRTIEAFKPDGTPMFSADVSIQETTEVAAITGDAVMGEVKKKKKCGRCHVVNYTNRMKAIGSTPSFALLRGFDDWQNRFEAFYVLKPHPAFTQVKDVTDPFASHLPSPIAPIEVTLEEIEAITAYVATIAPADLGAPIQSQ